MSEPAATSGLAARIGDLRGLDTVDGCRIRLVAIRTRIETNWPTQGGLLRRGSSLAASSQAVIADLLVGLPSPLPLEAGGKPVPLIRAGEPDLMAAAGRAVDAAMALLVDASLDTTYHGTVTLLRSYQAGAEEPITLANPTVGLLVATIIGTLEAIVERIGPGGNPKPPANAKGSQQASRPESGKGSPTSKGKRDVGRR